MAKADAGGVDGAAKPKAIGVVGTAVANSDANGVDGAAKPNAGGV